MTILELTRTDEQLTPDGEMIDWYWQTFGVGGHFSLRATGYTQYFRRPPLHTKVQRLSLEERDVDRGVLNVDTFFESLHDERRRRV